MVTHFKSFNALNPLMSVQVGTMVLYCCFGKQNNVLAIAFQSSTMRPYLPITRLAIEW